MLYPGTVSESCTSEKLSNTGHFSVSQSFWDYTVPSKSVKSFTCLSTLLVLCQWNRHEEVRNCLPWSIYWCRMIWHETTKTGQGFGTRFLRTRTPNMETAAYPYIVYLLLMPAIYLRKIKQVKSSLIEKIRDTQCLTMLWRHHSLKKTRRDDFKKENLTEQSVEALKYPLEGRVPFSLVWQTFSWQRKFNTLYKYPDLQMLW